MRPLVAVCLGPLLLALPARAEAPLPDYAAYQARFYQRLGAECLKRAGPQPQCFALLEDSLSFDANAPIIHFTLGKYYGATGDLSRATGAFSRALELDPGFHAALVALGDVYAARDQPAEARGWYQRYIQVQPSDPEGYYGVAATWAQQLEEAQALGSLKGALKYGFVDADRLRQDPRWRHVLGSPALEALLSPLDAATPAP